MILLSREVIRHLFFRFLGGFDTEYYIATKYDIEPQLKFMHYYL